MLPRHVPNTPTEKGKTEVLPLFFSSVKDLLYLLNDGFESLRVVYCEVGEHLTVYLDTSLAEFTHENRIAHTLETSSSIDTLNPQTAEIALLVAAVTICIGETLFPGVFGYCPNIFAGTKVATSELKNSFTLCS